MEDFPAGGWSVEDGLLIVEYSGNEEEGYGGSIITREKYKDFELELEYLLTDTANSGIFYLVLEREGQVIWNNAPEFQLIDDAVYEALLGEDWMNTHRTGDNYDLHMADSNYSRPVGEWNSARILKRGNHIEHWVNGHKTVEYELGSAEWRALVEKSKFAEFPEYGTAVEGHIGLQDHGHRVAFRDIRVRRL